MTETCQRQNLVWFYVFPIIIWQLFKVDSKASVKTHGEMRLNFITVVRKSKQNSLKWFKILPAYVICKRSLAWEKKQEAPSQALQLWQQGSWWTLFSWSCKCPGKEEMFCQSHGLHNVFKNMLISSSMCYLSFLFLCFVFEVADCFQRQTEFQSSHLLLVPGPVAYFLRNIVVFLQTSWGEAKLNSKHVPLVLLLLFTPGVNRDPPRNSLCSVQMF